LHFTKSSRIKEPASNSDGSHQTQILNKEVANHNTDASDEMTFVVHWKDLK
jgi:hypothetical protein